nr:TonB-dependent receptor [uncultured Pedobacter sp.]
MTYTYNFKVFNKLLFVCLLLVFAISARAQTEKTIRGTVQGINGETIPGVTVTQKGTKNTTQTDLSGKYQIKMLKGSNDLVFSFLGFKTLTQTIGASNTVNITLKEDLLGLQEVVVTGYTVEKKRDVLGSIGSIKAEQIEQTTPIGALDAIQGRMAGVSISTNNGPGNGTDIKIRGTSTLSGGVNPLYVVDGQQLDNIDNLNPNDIASIEVLKDGASAAIYGAQSANGVVIVTTKKGKVGHTKVDATYVRTYSDLTSTLPVANTRQRLLSEFLKKGTDPTVNQDSLSIRLQQNPDLQSEITRTSVRDEFNMSFSGANQRSDFYANLGYLNQNGIVINSAYKRINSNINLNFDINNTIKAGFRINSSYQLTDGLDELSVFRHLIRRPAYYPVRDFDGSLFPLIAGLRNPLAQAEASTNTARVYRAQLFNFVEVKISKDLKFRSTLGGNFGFNKKNVFNPSIVQPIGQDPVGYEQENLAVDYQHEDYFTYNKKIGKNNITGLAGFQLQKWNQENSLIYGTFNSDLITTFNNVKVLDLTRLNNDTQEQHSLMSFYGKVGYDYSGKYLFSATLRRDGSSRFGVDKRFGNFPSVAAGWRVSDEDFMKSLKKTISDLKLRVAYGVNGNERIGNYDALALYAPGSYYDGLNGVATTRLANVNLSWERTKSINYGLDLSLFDGIINLTADAYVKTTDNLLYDVPLPTETGYSSIRANIGSVENRGLEFFISATPLKVKNFQWTSSFNIAFNKNKVLSLNNPAGFETAIYQIKPGESLGNMYGYTQLGVFPYDQSNAFTPDGVQLTPTFGTDGKTFTGYNLNGQVYTGDVKQLKVGSTVLKGGDIYWKDLNGDFNIDKENDRSVLGNGYAKAFGGFFNEFKYKDFGFSFLFDFNFGNDIYRQYDVERDFSTAYGQTAEPAMIDNAWRKQGDITIYPSLDSKRTENFIAPNSFFVNKADYIKLRNVKLNYILPRRYLDKVKWIKGASLSVSANNPLVWTNYPGYNPELGTRGNPLQPGYDNLRYPSYREIILGLNAQF